MRRLFKNTYKSIILPLALVCGMSLVAPSFIEAAIPPKGNELFSFTSRLSDIAFNEQGHIFAALGGGGIDVFDRCGNFLFNFFQDESVTQIAVNKNGQIVAASGTQAFVFNPQGKLLFKFDVGNITPPLAIGDLAVDEDGRIYLMVPFSSLGQEPTFRVRVFDSCGNFLFELEEEFFSFSSPPKLAVNSKKQIIVVGEVVLFENNIWVFNPKGTLLSKLQLDFASDAVAVNEAGQILIFSKNIAKVYSSSGKFLFEFPTGIDLVLGVAVSSDGLIAVSDSSNREIKIFE